MAEWHKEKLRLKDAHGWRVSPGHLLFVADRGAVRFEIPRGWVVEPGPDSMRIYDCPQPDDECMLQVSVMYLNPKIDWTDLRLGPLVEEITDKDDRKILSRGKVIERRRPGLDLAWRELRVIDPRELRPAVSRYCFARAGTIQPLITMDYWPEFTKRFEPVWDHVLRTLRLGEFITDPTLGPKLN